MTGATSATRAASVRTAAEQHLQCAAWQLGVSSELITRAAGRCHTGQFLTTSSDAPVLRVEEVDALSEAERKPLEGSLAPWGFYAVAGDTVRAHIPDDVWAAESVLRVAWQIATLRQGGVLMHGCAFELGGIGLAAIGHSGAGKSTLATLASGHPAHAKLLTDEIVQLFPDGTVWGSPFRSNVECVGSPGGVPLRSLLLLTKGPHEALEPVPATAAVPELLGQLYRTVTDEVAQVELVRRVLSVVDRVGVHRLTFRKDAAVGPFLREWVRSNGA